MEVRSRRHSGRVCCIYCSEQDWSVICVWPHVQLLRSSSIWQVLFLLCFACCTGLQILEWQQPIWCQMMPRPEVVEILGTFNPLRGVPCALWSFLSVKFHDRYSLTPNLCCRSEEVDWGGDGDVTMEEMTPEVSAVESAPAIETSTPLCRYVDLFCCFCLRD